LRLRWISPVPPWCSSMVTKLVTIGGARFALAVTISSLHRRILYLIRIALKTDISFEWPDTHLHICVCLNVVPHDEVTDRFVRSPLEAADRDWR
jgi:hypothetical protein